MNQNIINNLKNKWNRPNGKTSFGLFIFFIIIILFFIANQGQNNNKDKYANKVIKEKTTGSEIKVKNSNINKDNKLKAATNPIVRRKELLKEQTKLNNKNETSLKVKYSNLKSEHTQQIMLIKKEKEKQKKQLIEKEQKIVELKKRLQKEKEQSQLTLKNNSIKEKNNIDKVLNKKNVFSKSMNLDLKKILITELFSNKEKSNNSSVKIATIVEKNTTNPQKNNKQSIIQQVRFKIVPGSSFYGQLTNVLYSGYLEPGPIIKVENSLFNNCNFIGTSSLVSAKGFAIKINKVACSDGYEQQINAYAFKLKDLRPVWTSKIEHHFLPKVILGSLDFLVNLVRINKNSNNTVNANGQSTNTPSLVDHILATELKRYKTEYVLNPQAIVVIFY